MTDAAPVSFTTDVASVTSARVSVTITPPPALSSGLEGGILAAIICGAVLAIILVGLAVFCILKRRRAQQPLSTKPAVPVTEQQPESEYAPINMASYDYAQLQLKPPSSSYDLVPAPDYDSGGIALSAT
jgi:hypothetical protein